MKGLAPLPPSPITSPTPFAPPPPSPAEVKSRYLSGSRLAWADWLGGGRRGRMEEDKIFVKGLVKLTFFDSNDNDNNGNK